MLQIIIQGRGGQGAQTAGNLLAMAFFAEGREVQSFASYGGARRGTPVSSFIRVDDRPIRVRCDIERADAILCFDASLLESRLLATARPDTLIVVNSSRTPEQFAESLPGYRVIPVDGISICAPPRTGTDRQFRTARRVCTGDRGAETRGAGPRAYRGGAEAARREHRGLRRGLPMGRGAVADGGGMNAKDAVPSIWTTGTTEVFKTGTWRAALPQHIHAPSPCHAACPVNGDIAEWIGRARARDFRGAWEILTRHNPFPAVAGRICHHPCEAACNRAGYRRVARDLPTRTLCRRSGARGGLGVCADRSAARGADRDRWRGTVGTIGSVPSATARLRGDRVRIASGAWRTYALRHSVVSPRAIRARWRDRAHRGSGDRRALR